MDFFFFLHTVFRDFYSYVLWSLYFFYFWRLSQLLQCIKSKLLWGHFSLIIWQLFRNSYTYGPKIVARSIWASKISELTQPQITKQKWAVLNLYQLYLLICSAKANNKTKSLLGLHPGNCWSFLGIFWSAIINVSLTNQVWKHNNFIKTTASLPHPFAWEPFGQGFCEHTSVLRSGISRQLTQTGEMIDGYFPAALRKNICHCCFLYSRQLFQLAFALLTSTEIKIDL